MTRFGVSVENVVATIEMPNNHHGMDWPPKKYDLKLLPEVLETDRPIPMDRAKKAAIMAQSKVESCIRESPVSVHAGLGRYQKRAHDIYREADNKKNSSDA